MPAKVFLFFVPMSTRLLDGQAKEKRCELIEDSL